MPRHLAGLVAASIAVAGCSGGSHSAVVPSSGSPTTSNASATTRVVAGYASITIVSPPGFFRARLGSASASGSTSRSPAYVDPGSTAYYLAIWSVNPATHTATQVVDTPITIGAAPHGQTLSVPIYSSDPNELVAIEYNANPNSTNNPNVLALGETDVGSFDAGNNTGGADNNGFATPGPTPSQSTPAPAGTTFPTAQITMAMYARYYGVMQTPDNTDASAVAYAPSAGTASYQVTSGTVYFFVADATGGSAPYQPGGIGGVAAPTLVSQQSGYPGAKLTGPIGGPSPSPNTAGFTATFVPSTATIRATIDGTNPAGLLWNANPQPPGLSYMYHHAVPNAWLSSAPNDAFTNESLGSFVFSLSTW